MKMKITLAHNENNSFCLSKTSLARKHAMDDGAGEVAVENGGNEDYVEDKS